MVIIIQKKIKCPVSTAMSYLWKKWTFEILRDLFLGAKHFNEILDSNKKYGGGLSAKVLTDRLNVARDPKKKPGLQ